jgi:hypothetical protein
MTGALTDPRICDRRCVPGVAARRQMGALASRHAGNLPQLSLEVRVMGVDTGGRGRGGEEKGSEGDGRG